MAEFTGTSQLNGFFYEVYDKIVDPIPESAKGLARIPYKGGALELGNKLHMNVITSDEGGFTHAAAGADAFAVDAGISMETQDAQIDGFQILMQSSIGYEAAAKASSSRKAFLEITGKKLQNVVASSKRRLECEMWHGQRGIGEFSANTAVSSGRTTLTCTAATWAPFIWQGKKNHQVVFFNTTTNAAISTYAFTVYAVDVANRKVTVQEVNTGDAALLHTAITTNGQQVRAFWKSTIDTASTLAAPTWKTMLGIMSIAQNTGSMFNINAAVYDVWQGNSLNVGGALSLKKILDGAAVLADRGVEGDLDAWVSNQAWGNIATDQAALRRYGAEVKEAKTGARSIEFYYQGSTVRLVAHGMIKGCEAALTETKKWKRIGARDFSFKVPGFAEGQDLFFNDPSKAGVTWRYYTNQATMCEMPSHQLVFTGIVNS
jgi:hypothetical protein